MTEDGLPDLPPHAFAKADPSPDAMFYVEPRFVTHIDDGAVAAVTGLYRSLFPSGVTVLDLMSSWVSHLPKTAAYAEVIGHGMNAAELAANPRLDRWFVQDLNQDPSLPLADVSVDAVAICVSIQYLQRPVKVLREVARVLRPGGIVAITFSNRCFPRRQWRFGKVSKERTNASWCRSICDAPASRPWRRGNWSRRNGAGGTRFGPWSAARWSAMRASRIRRLIAAPLLAWLAGAAIGLVMSACSAAAPDVSVSPAGPPGLAAERFPRPQRPVAGIVSDQWASEDSRERVGEAARVMDLLDIRPGMAVADIGAGAGYYVGRLAQRVGPEGRVIAQDIDRRTLNRLAQRVARERLGNVSLVLGEPHDPRLAPDSADLALLVHMYHEIAQPFGLLANLIPAMRPGGRVAILDVDGPIVAHGTPRALLSCELAAVGYREVAWHWVEGRSVYLAVFEPPAEPPEPKRIAPCGGR